MPPPIIRLKIAASTNDVAREFAQNGAPHGLIVVAQSQTAGRGQRGHAWLSPPGGLYASFILRPNAWPVRHAPLLAPLAGLALFRTLSALHVPRLQAIPPNDIFADGRKLAGILVEPRLSTRKIEFAIVGVGLNLNPPIPAFPHPLNTTATSCHLLGLDLSPNAILSSLPRELDTLLSTPPHTRAAAWLAACSPPPPSTANTPPHLP